MLTGFPSVRVITLEPFYNGFHSVQRAGCVATEIRVAISALGRRLSKWECNKMNNERTETELCA